MLVSACGPSARPGREARGSGVGGEGPVVGEREEGGPARALTDYSGVEAGGGARASARWAWAWRTAPVACPCGLAVRRAGRAWAGRTWETGRGRGEGRRGRGQATAAGRRAAGRVHGPFARQQSRARARRTCCSSCWPRSVCNVTPWDLLRGGKAKRVAGRRAGVGQCARGARWMRQGGEGGQAAPWRQSERCRACSRVMGSWAMCRVGEGGGGAGARARRVGRPCARSG